MTNAPRKRPAKTPVGRRFEKGNPGKKPGTRSRVTILAEKLMQDDADDVVRAVIEQAKAGDMQAAKLILDRIAPPRRGSPVLFDIPKIEAPADLVAAIAALVAATAEGALSPDEAAVVAGLLETQRRAIETVELEARLAALEDTAPQKEPHE